MKRILFIVNPISGTHRSDNIEKMTYSTLDKSKFDISFERTEYKGHASELARNAVADNVDIVAAVGGDGTINEVASEIVNTDTAFAVVPHGSGNGLAYHLHIPIQVKKSLQIINDLHIEPIDTCQVNGRSFFSIAGIGFDAKVAYDFDKDVRRGFQNYLKYILKNFFTYKSVDYLLNYDGKQQNVDAFFITFANSSQWGYNVKIAPKASVQDGKLDVCITQRPKFLRMLNIDLPFLLSNHFDKSTLVQYVQCEHIQVTSQNNESIYLHIDGDPAGLVDTVELRVLPLSLKMVLPKIKF